jgi:ketopantoate hydroxymethyltransferase
MKHRLPIFTCGLTLLVGCATHSSYVQVTDTELQSYKETASQAVNAPTAWQNVKREYKGPYAIKAGAPVTYLLGYRGRGLYSVLVPTEGHVGWYPTYVEVVLGFLEGRSEIVEMHEGFWP